MATMLYPLFLMVGLVLMDLLLQSLLGAVLLLIDQGALIRKVRVPARSRTPCRW